ncbi:MAG: hypothetical protein WC175_06475 [Candidatus Dojkabacteria bacterium]
MSDDKNRYENILCKLEEDSDVTMVSEDQTDCILTYYIKEILTDDAHSRVVKAVEKLVRQSREYSEYIGLLRNNLNIKRCTFLKNCNDADATIEFHHYPFTLYDVVEIVINKYLLEKRPFSTFLIASEVLRLHYDNMVGLVPVSITVHQLTHAGELFINIDQVFGYFQNFVMLYQQYMRNYHKKKYNEILEKSKQEVIEDSIVLRYTPLILTPRNELEQLFSFELF